MTESLSLIICVMLSDVKLQYLPACESWTLRKNEETRPDAFEIKWLRKILLVSWTAKKTNEWVHIKAGVKSELLDTVKARKLAYYGHTVRKQWSCMEKKIIQGTIPGARRRGRPRTAWTDNIKTWTGRVSQNDRGQRKMEKVHLWCGQPSDRGRLINKQKQTNRIVIRRGILFEVRLLRAAIFGRIYSVKQENNTLNSCQ